MNIISTDTEAQSKNFNGVYHNKVENYEEFKELAADRAIKALKKFIKAY